MTRNLDTSIRLRAFAKINLGLKIVGRRPDHYHELRTVLQTVSLHDRLEVNRKRHSRSIEVLCDAAGLLEGADNLVYRTCELWRRWRGLRIGLEVRIEKAIPAGSGLGGASTDAFAALLGLERITGDRMPEAARLHLASQLGSDVPFFHWGGRAFAVGRGEEVYPLSDLPSRYCLIVYPDRSISTADAFPTSWVNVGRKKRGRIVCVLLPGVPISPWKNGVRWRMILSPSSVPKVGRYDG